MKDSTRPHPAPSSRTAPYRKRKSLGNLSPPRGTRRAYDASKPGPREMTSPSDRRRDEAQLSRPTLHSPADGDRHGLGGNRAVSHTRRHTTTDRERPSHSSALSTHADVPGPSLRLPLTPTTSTLPGQGKAESPPPGSVTAFLRSIELPDKLSSVPPTQKSFSFTPPSRRLPPLSTDNTDNLKAACASHQVSLVYKGYPFTCDLAALPDDPKGTIALLSITKSDPGAYILVGAHYRRTGRSRAACAVIRSLLDGLDSDSPSDVEKEKGDGTHHARLRTLCSLRIRSQLYPFLPRPPLQ